jgi:hypothetical protein
VLNELVDTTLIVRYLRLPGFGPKYLRALPHLYGKVNQSDYHRDHADNLSEMGNLLKIHCIVLFVIFVVPMRWYGCPPLFTNAV